MTSQSAGGSPAPAHQDRRHLLRAVELSRLAVSNEGDLPFGALVVVGKKVVAEARNEVATRHDPTAHAEVLALRIAGARIGLRGLREAVLYSSSEPCPMCLAACYWARIARVVHAATVHDTADHGFEDLEYYRQLALPRQERKLVAEPGDERARGHALDALHDWSNARSGGRTG